MEIWKDIKNYEGLYQVSNLGRIKTLSRKIPFTDKLGRRHERTSKEKIKSPAPTRGGYNSIGLNKNGVAKTFRLCRLVAIHFISNNDCKKFVNHIDGDKTNDKASNLEWCTASENMKHAYLNGLISKRTGSDCFQSIKIRCTSTDKVFDTIKDASDYCGYHSSHLSRMLRGVYKNKTTLVYA